MSGGVAVVLGLVGLAQHGEGFEEFEGQEFEGRVRAFEGAFESVRGAFESVRRAERSRSVRGAFEGQAP